MTPSSEGGRGAEREKETDATADEERAEGRLERKMESGAERKEGRGKDQGEREAQKEKDPSKGEPRSAWPHGPLSRYPRRRSGHGSNEGRPALRT